MVRAGRPLMLLVLVAALSQLSVCGAGRVFFPGPSIGPAPPALWQSLHGLRQARRLDGNTGDGAPELRAAGVRIGQKYSDLEQRPPLQPQPETQQDGETRLAHDGELQPFQHGDLTDPQPLEPLDILGPLEIRDLSDVEPNNAPRPVRVSEPGPDSQSLQSLAPLPIFLAVEPREAELSNGEQPHTPEPRGFNSIIEGHHSDTFRNGQADTQNNGPRNKSPNDYSAPNADDIITLDEAFDISKPAFLTADIPEGVVYAAAAAHEAIVDEKHQSPSRGGPLAPRRDLQSSASVLDPASVDLPEADQSLHRSESGADLPRARPAAIAAAGSPPPPDQNLLNLLVTQGVLRPVGRVRVAQLRLITEDQPNLGQERNGNAVVLTPARSDSDGTAVEPGADEEPYEAPDERRQYREEPDERRKYREEPDDQGPFDAETVQSEAEDIAEQGLQAPSVLDDERELVLASNAVPILSEKEVFDRLVTPRASSSSTISSAGSSRATDTVSEPSGDEPEDVKPATNVSEEPEQPVASPRADSLAARLTELVPRVSRQGTWGRRLSGAAARLRAEPERRGRWRSWQRRVDTEQPMFIDTDTAAAATADLDTQGSERHEQVAVQDEDGAALHEALVVTEGEAGKQVETTGLRERYDQPPKVAETPQGNDRDETKSPETKQTDILTERTVKFRTGNTTKGERSTNYNTFYSVLSVHS